MRNRLGIALAAWRRNALQQGGGSQGAQGALLPSAGIGLIFSPGSHIHSDLYWGYGFNRRDVDATKIDPRDCGFYLTISVDAF